MLIIVPFLFNNTRIKIPFPPQAERGFFDLDLKQRQ